MPPRPHVLPSGFIAPCLPTNAPTPSGAEWVHEIKFDGFRVIARKNDKRVKLYSRPGNDLTDRFPLIVEALARLRSRSCVIDGDAIACAERLPVRPRPNRGFGNSTPSQMLMRPFADVQAQPRDQASGNNGQRGRHRISGQRLMDGQRGSSSGVCATGSPEKGWKKQMISKSCAR
jgi:hypothetical protein